MSKEKQSKEKDSAKKGETRGKRQTENNRDETKMEDEFSSRAASLETIS